MLNLKNIIIIFSCIVFVASCTENKNAEQLSAGTVAESTAKDIHEVEANIGTAPGEEIFKTSCLTCHSLRYIQMQPSFPRKTWEKIVGKMIKNFGAPIPDSSAAAIVDYLMEVKGKEK